MMVLHRGLLAVAALSSVHAFAILTSPAGKRTSTALQMSKGKFNPFSNMLGDFTSSIMGPKSAEPADNKVDATLTSLEPSWDTVRSTLHALQTPEERSFRDNLSTGRGQASPLHTLRLYDDGNTEKDVRVTFFRDSASWCPYCQKVWLMLEEKRIPYRVDKINMRCYGEKPAEFTRMQPSGQIPVAIIDDKVYGQSNDIMLTLEELFPEHKSLKATDPVRGQEMLRLERRLFSAWMYWLTSGGGGQELKAAFVSTFQEVEAALQESNGPFFMGKDVTLVDFMFAPFLERMCASLLYFKGFQIRVAPKTPTDYPNVNKWFDAMETLDSYRLTKSDYYTHCWDLPPQLGGCSYEDAGEPFEKAINGERRLDGSGGSWELPLQPHNGGVEPDWTWAGDTAAAQREAVERLSANFENVVAFAARGAGRKGMPPYSAVLADPNAVPNEVVENGVSAVLQTVSMALLEGVDKYEAVMDQMADAIVNQGGSDYANGIVASLSYLRDRVGVPRDMRLPAARQLRAHLNWAIGKVLAAQE